MVLPHKLWIVATFSVGLLAGMLAHVWPQWAPSNVYFGVPVRPDYKASSEGRRVLHWYRVQAWLHVLTGFGLISLGVWAGHSLYIRIGALWFLVGLVVAVQWARKNVMPSRITAETTREATLDFRSPHVRGEPALLLGPFALLGTTAMFLRQDWAEISARFPIRSDFNGHATRWVYRSPLGVYGPLLIAGFICAAISLLAYGSLHRARRVEADRRVQGRGDFLRRQYFWLIGFNYWLALTFSAMVGMLPIRNSHISSVVGIFTGLAFLALIASGLVLKFTQGGGGRQSNDLLNLPLNSSDKAEGTLEDYWKGGVFYFNRNDPALFVPGRGWRYTMNFGHVMAFSFFGLIAIGVTIAVAAFW